MTRRNWKKVFPTSLRNAMELCVEHARDKKNLSVDRIAERMGMESHYTLYKWLESGRMPAIMIIPFESACGENFVTRYLGNSQGFLVSPIPTGRKAEHRDINALSQFITGAMQQYYQYHDGELNAEEMTGVFNQVMESLAYHRGNVEKAAQPELEL